MAFDLNRKRHRREMAVAKEFARELLATVTSTTEAAPPHVLAHHFAHVCERMEFMPDDAAVGRIMNYALKNIDQRGREVGRLARELDRVTGR